MRINTVVPILAVAATATAGPCKPDPSKSTSVVGGWPVDPKASATVTGWSSDPTATAGGSGEDWTAGGSGGDWTAIVPTGSLIPGQPGNYGTFTKPGSLPTGNVPPPYNHDSGPSWGSTSGDAQNNPGAPNSPDHRGCWGGGFDINTPPNSWPQSDKVCSYEFVMQNTTLSLDGDEKQMLTINGQYPGPLVECEWGGIIEVTVKNELLYNGTGIHWHGFRQEGTNEMDGVPGVTECPIAPGDTKVYRFRATSYGTTWYHSHFSIQYGDGVKGPVLIHGPTSMNYDIDLGTVMLDETYPLTAFQEDHFAHIQGPPQASNVLFNGKNIKPDLSAGERQKWAFTKGKKHLLRLINTSVDSMFSVQIDNHNLTIISNDFVPINPYNTTSLSIGIGQRYDIIVEASQSVDSYWFRAIPQQGANTGPPSGGPPQGCCSNVNTGLGTANAIIQYEGASDALPTTNYTAFSITCNDEPIASLVPVVTKTVDSTGFASTQSNLPVNLQGSIVNGQRVNFWFLNGISQDIDWSTPTLEQVVGGNDSFPTIRDVITLKEKNVWTFWVIQNLFFVPHPMHLHGHDFSLLGQGNGTFDPSTMTDLLNFDNPTRRDVAMLPAQGWTVIAFETDNPGAWLMHCHIGWHVGEGLSLQFLEVPDQIPGIYTSAVESSDFQDTCTKWDAYYDAGTVYNKTDSGLRKRDYAYAQNHRMDVTRHLHDHLHRRAKMPHEY